MSYRYFDVFVVQRGWRAELNLNQMDLESLKRGWPSVLSSPRRLDLSLNSINGLIMPHLEI